jgi:hypothetical protein
MENSGQGGRAMADNTGNREDKALDARMAKTLRNKLLVKNGI